MIFIETTASVNDVLPRQHGSKNPFMLFFWYTDLYEIEGGLIFDLCAVVEKLSDNYETISLKKSYS